MFGVGMAMGRMRMRSGEGKRAPAPRGARATRCMAAQHGAHLGFVWRVLHVHARDEGPGVLEQLQLRVQVLHGAWR